MSTRRAETRPRSKLGEGDLFALRFYGAAREVTGSRFLLQTRRSEVLFECGLGQAAGRSITNDNARWPFPVNALDAVVLTHAHVDHSGLLPRLVRDGYRGSVHTTSGTADLCKVLLPDAAWIQEHEAERTNRRLRRQARPTVRPLYTEEDARRALDTLRPHPWAERIPVSEDVTVRFQRAGHILGAASVEVWVRDEANHRRIVFSGDIGRADSPVLLPPAPLKAGELIVMESTYGDRNHRSMEATLEEFGEILDDAEKRRENVLIPTFTVGRAQEVLFHIRQFERQGRLKPRKVFLDSPMAIDVTHLHRSQAAEMQPWIAREIEAGDDPFAPERLVCTRTAEQSKAINEERGAIILAGSGMCQGGRIMHHLKHHLWRRGTHVVIVGFQARGTTGRAIVDGAEMVKIRGQRIAVRAQVHTIGGFSAHADQAGLLDWLGQFREAGDPAVALVHGEEGVQETFAAAIQERFGRQPMIPSRGDTIVMPRSGDAIRLESSAKA